MKCIKTQLEAVMDGAKYQQTILSLYNRKEMLKLLWRGRLSINILDHLV